MQVRILTIKVFYAKKAGFADHVGVSREPR